MAENAPRVPFDPDAGARWLNAHKLQVDRIHRELAAMRVAADRVARRLKPGLRPSRFPRRPLNRWGRG